MKFDEYRACDATELARLVAAKDVTATELLETALERAAQVKSLNSIIMPMESLARKRAKSKLSGPFAGVPFLLKDLMQEYAGVPYSMGNKALKQSGSTPKANAEIVNRWLAAGLVPFGRTNTPEFGAKAITEPEAWGVTRNPWNLEYIPGGSSGGSAAAVAAGVVPLAGANDGGGSIRIPAACCGLFGLKPGRGRTPMGPELGEELHGAVTNHVLTRSVRDSAAMLDAVCGPETASLFHIAPPKKSYLDAIKQPPKKLRVGVCLESAFGDISADARKAVDKTIRLLVNLGHEVDVAKPDIDAMQLAKDFLTMWFVKCHLSVQEVRKQTGCGWDGFELDTRALAAFGGAITAVEYAQCYHRWLTYSRKLGQFFESYDLLLTPTLASPPAKIGEIATPEWQRQILKVALHLPLSRLLLDSGVVEKMAHENLKWVPFTQLANLTGVPAMSVPLHWCDNGLPLGTQFVGPHGSEGTLLQLAAQFEGVAPWFNQQPSL